MVEINDLEKSDNILNSLERLLNNFDKNNEIPSGARVRLTLDTTLKGPTLGELIELDSIIREEF